MSAGMSYLYLQNCFPAGKPPDPETSSLSGPPDKDFGISCATFFWWSWVAEPSRLLTACEILPPSVSILSLRALRGGHVCAPAVGECEEGGSHLRPLKELCSRDTNWWGRWNATASRHSASCLVSRLQLVPLTTAFLFAPAGDPQSPPSSAPTAEITPDNCSRDNCFNKSDFRNGISMCGWTLMVRKHEGKGADLEKMSSILTLIGWGEVLRKVI